MEVKRKEVITGSVDRYKGGDKLVIEYDGNRRTTPIRIAKKSADTDREVCFYISLEDAAWLVEQLTDLAAKV